MKKISLFILVVFCLVLTGCNNKTKEVHSLDDFEEACVSDGLTVNDNLVNYSDSSYITGAKIAKNDDITIEMVTYDSIDKAKEVQERQIDSFMTLKSTGAIIDKDKGKNFYRYSMISNGYYMVNSRIDNTLIFAKVLLDDKDTINNILDSIDY